MREEVIISRYETQFRNALVQCNGANRRLPYPPSPGRTEYSVSAFIPTAVRL